MPGCPECEAGAVRQGHSVRGGGGIVEQRGVGDRDAVRKTGRAAAVLKIAGRVGFLLWQRGDGGGPRLERAPVDGGDTLRLGGLGRHGGDFGREEEHDRIAARKLAGELADQGCLAAETVAPGRGTQLRAGTGGSGYKTGITGDGRRWGAGR